MGTRKIKRRGANRHRRRTVPKDIPPGELEKLVEQNIVRVVEGIPELTALGRKMMQMTHTHNQDRGFNSTPKKTGRR